MLPYRGAVFFARHNNQLFTPAVAVVVVVDNHRNGAVKSAQGNIGYHETPKCFCHMCRRRIAGDLRALSSSSNIYRVKASGRRLSKVKTLPFVVAAGDENLEVNSYIYLTQLSGLSTNHQL